MNRKMRYFLIFSFFSLGLTSLFAQMEPGDLDTTFGTGGIATTNIVDQWNNHIVCRAIVIQPDDKIIVAGSHCFGDNYDFDVVRFNIDGSIDNSFSGDGLTSTNFTGNSWWGGSSEWATSVAIQSDGKIVAAGYYQPGGYTEFAVVRYNSDGSLDNDFGENGIVTTNIGSNYAWANSVAIQEDGKIVLAGYHRMGVFPWGSNHEITVVRYNSDGSLDNGFGNGGIVSTLIGANSIGYSVAIQLDGKIIVAGSSYDGIDNDICITRYNTNGGLDNSFGINGVVTTDIGGNSDIGYSILIQIDRKIVVSGTCYNGTNNDFTVLRYNNDGSLDTDFGINGKVITPVSENNDIARSIAIQSAGKIVVAGYSDGSNDIAIVRYDNNGDLDGGFGNNGIVKTDVSSNKDYGYGVAIQSDDKIVVAGYTSEFFVVRYIGFSPLQQDSLVLIAFYDSTNGDNWTNSTNWKTDQPVSAWLGITVSNDRVTQVILKNNNLVGPLPAIIGNLDSLEILHLEKNQLSDHIPSEIGNLTNLTGLSLYGNQLTGSIPSEIGNLTNLWGLWLYGNQLTGSIPPEIGNLTNLVRLSLYGNQLTGSISPQIGNLSNLENLWLFSNKLTGSIPPEIGNLTNLIYLYLHDNELIGSIPLEIGNLGSLQYLYLHMNKFTDLPDLSSITTLIEIKIENNKFTFEDIEPNIGIASSFSTYSSQDSIGAEQDTTIDQGESLTLTVSVGGTANQYQWLKDETAITGADSSSYTISSVDLADDGSYTCEITNTVATELTLYSRPINITVNVPPAVPKNLSATPGNQQITLYWNKNTESDLHKYNIYRDNSSPATTLIDSCVASSPPDTFYTDAGLTNGQINYYRITAVDNAGNESGYSSEVSATPRPQIYTVKKDGSGDFTSIQSTIDAATHGDTVLVHPGTYVENINFNGKNIVVGSMFLTTQDTSYISSTIIDGNQNGSVVTFESGETSSTMLVGFKIQNGYAQGYFPDGGVGGGIYCASSNPTLKNLTISGNIANQWGGGVVLLTSNPTIEGVTISGNSADNGGGINLNSSDPSLFNVTIIGNSASGYGGGMSCNSSRPGLVNVTISGNSAESAGGILCNNYYVSLLNSVISGNSPDEIYISSGGVIATYSNIQGGWEGTGNIDADPLFIDPSNGNYSLTDYSPCIGAGLDTSIVLITDLDGNPRPNPAGSNPDMGAYENTLTTPLHNSFIHVDTTGNDSASVGLESAPFATIQASIDYSNDGDTVSVHPGTYVENINFNGKNIVVGSLFLTTQDTSYISQTIIDGNQNGSVVTFENSEDTTSILIGLTIENGSTVGFNFPKYNGSGIYCYETNPLIRYCKIRNNITGTYGKGGGIYIFHSSNSRIISCEIYDNYGHDAGGGIYLNNAQTTIENCFIKNNQSGWIGGGIYNEMSYNVIIDKCFLIKNSAESQGGGIYDDHSTSTLIRNTVIADNSCNLWAGSGFYNKSGNQAYPNLIINSVFSNNSDNNNPFLYNDGTLYIRNTILSPKNLSSHIIGTGGDSELNIDYSLFDSDSFYIDNYGDLSIGNYNLLDNPRFIDSSQYNFHLGNNSPCIGAGVDSFQIDGTWHYAPLADLDGNLRPNPAGSNPDMGAYENSLSAPFHNSFIHVDTTGNDSASVGLESAPLATIQAAIDYSNDGDTVLVQPGTYVENINFNGKNIVVGSLFLTTEDTSYISQTIIDGNQDTSVVIFSNGETASSVLSGFTIQNGLSNWGGGIYCSASPTLSNLIISTNSANLGGGVFSIGWGSSPIIDRCIINNNQGHGVFLWDAPAKMWYSSISNNSLAGVEIYGGSTFDLINCTVVDNDGSGINLGYLDQSPNIINSIIYGNEGQQFISEENDNPNVIYSDIQDTLWHGDGNIDVDPRFIDADNDNYHLLASSICINAGHPDSTDVDGTRSDMGAYPYLNTYSGPNWYVSTEGNDTTATGADTNPFSSIQAGINFATTAGDSVSVALGTYTENINFRGRAIKVFGEQGAENTIIDGDSSGSVVTFGNGEDSTSVLSGFTIQNGNAQAGGGIYCMGSSPNLVNVTASGNTASYEGGGIYCQNSNLSLENVIILGNLSESNGGGIFCFNSSPGLENVTISGNAAPYGGGISCGETSLSLMNVTISGNTADNGGGIFCSSNSTPSLVNTILWNDSPQEIYFDDFSNPHSVTISYSNVQGGQDSIVTNDNGTVNWGIGNIDTDPLFIDATIGNYRLTDYSPCIGTGLDTSIVPITDLDGNPRPNPAGSNPDMGAYENSRATPIDTIPPAIPQNLVITDYLQTITLKWNASINADLSHYNIYRASSPDFSTDSIYFKGKVFAPDTTYIDSLIQNNNTYYYQVTAVDTTGNESDPSDELVITAIVVDIRDITFQQRVDGSGLVNIYYSFSGHDTTHYEVIPYLSNFNDEAWGKLTQVSGDAGAVLPGDSRQITWNLKSEAPEMYSNNSTIKITIGLPSKGSQYNPLNEAKIQIDERIER